MSRESFEAWIKLDSTLSVERDGDGYADMDVYLMWRVWPVAQDDAFERAAKVCEVISDDYQSRESLRYPEMKTDAATGAGDCELAIRALAKESA